MAEISLIDRTVGALTDASGQTVDVTRAERQRYRLRGNASISQFLRKNDFITIKQAM